MQNTQNTALIPRRRNPAVKKSHLIQVQNNLSLVMDYIKEKEEEGDKKAEIVNLQLKNLLENSKIVAEHFEKIEKKLKKHEKTIARLEKNMDSTDAKKND